MRVYRSAVALTAAWAALLAFVPVTNGAGAENTVVRRIADLNGDGRPDTVVVTFPPSYDRYRAQIGTAVYEGLGEELHGVVIVVDVDRADRSLDLAIPQSGPNDDDAVQFLRYSGGEIQLIGIVPGTELRIDGSGTIQTECRGRILCTWYYPCQFRWSPAAKVLWEVPQAFKPMSVEVTLKKDMALTADPFRWRKAATIRAGAHAVIDLTDDQTWCHIVSKDGTKGWFSVEGMRVGWPAEVDVLDVFDGLPMAD